MSRVEWLPARNGLRTSEPTRRRTYSLSLVLYLSDSPGEEEQGLEHGGRDTLHGDGFQVRLLSVHRKAIHSRRRHHAHAIETSRYDCPGSWLLGDAAKLGTLDPAL